MVDVDVYGKLNEIRKVFAKNGSRTAQNPHITLCSPQVNMKSNGGIKAAECLSKFNIQHILKEFKQMNFEFAGYVILGQTQTTYHAATFTEARNSYHKLLESYLEMLRTACNAEFIGQSEGFYNYGCSAKNEVYYRIPNYELGFQNADYTIHVSICTGRDINRYYNAQSLAQLADECSIRVSGIRLCTSQTLINSAQ